MITGEHNPARWVVVGVDASPESETAVRYAAREARCAGAGLRLVHAVPSFPEGLALVAVNVIDSETAAPAGRAILRRASEAARAEASEVPIECRLLAGDRREAVLEEETDAREIVLGHDPSPSLVRLATGSTVLGVAARASVPVVVVTPGQEATAHGLIVVGIKRLKSADALLRRGFELAAQRHAAVRFVYAWEMPAGYESLAPTKKERDELSRTVSEKIGAALEAVAKEFPDVTSALTVVHGNPGRVLEDASHTVDLLVLERRPHVFPVGHIGATARAVLRHSACPVMFVPPALATAAQAVKGSEAGVVSSVAPGIVPGVVPEAVAGSEREVETAAEMRVVATTPDLTGTR